MGGFFDWLEGAIGTAEHYVQGIGGIFDGLRDLWGDARSWFGGPGGRGRGDAPPWGAVPVPWYAAIPWWGWLAGGFVLFKAMK